MAKKLIGIDRRSVLKLAGGVAVTGLGVRSFPMPAIAQGAPVRVGFMLPYTGTYAAIGKTIGPSSSATQMPEVVGRLLETYVPCRVEGERFVDTVQRLGIAPFKEHVYATPIAAGELTGEDHYA